VCSAAQLDSTDLEHVHHVGVRAKEDVQAGLIPVTVLVLPCSNLSTQQQGQQGKIECSILEELGTPCSRVKQGLMGCNFTSGVLYEQPAAG
jgi:hypothetical protein